MAQENSAKRSSLSKLQRRKYMWAYAFMAPQLILYLLFTIYPIIMGYIYTLYQWNGIGPLTDFIGLGNFKRLFSDPTFLSSVKISFIYLGGTLVLVLPFSLILALILNSKVLKGRVIFRTAFFLPVVSTTAIMGILMRYIFGYEGSPVNTLLLDLGIINEAIPWLQQSKTALIVLIIIGTWFQFGVALIYWLAAIQTLPQDIYEAAKIDGSGIFNTFRYITLPLLIPPGIVILLLTVVNGLNVFDLAKTLTNGGPFYGTTTVDLYIYELVFDSGVPRIGYGSTAGVVFGFIVFLITGLIGLVSLFVSRRNEK